jgi:hypothetical protein
VTCLLSRCGGLYAERLLLLVQLLLQKLCLCFELTTLLQRVSQLPLRILLSFVSSLCCCRGSCCCSRHLLLQCCTAGSRCCQFRLQLCSALLVLGQFCCCLLGSLCCLGCGCPCCLLQVCMLCLQLLELT